MEADNVIMSEKVTHMLTGLIFAATKVLMSASGVTLEPC